MPLVGDTGPHLDSWEDGSGGLSQEGVASRRLLQQDREGELVWRGVGGGGGDELGRVRVIPHPPTLLGGWGKEQSGWGIRNRVGGWVGDDEQGVGKGWGIKNRVWGRGGG